MRRSRLDGFAVFRECFGRKRIQRAGEFLVFGFASAHHGDREHLAIKIGVHLQCALHHRIRFFFGRMTRVSFLPEKFQRS